MAGCHHQLNGPEFEQTLRDGEGQGNPACYSPRLQRVGHDLMTEHTHQIWGRVIKLERLFQMRGNAYATLHEWGEKMIQDSPKEIKFFPVILCLLFQGIHPIAHFSYPI